jgi:hypothetical protein
VAGVTVENSVKYVYTMTPCPTPPPVTCNSRYRLSERTPTGHLRFDTQGMRNVMAIAAVTMATTAAQTVVDNALTRRGLTQEHAQEAPALETRNFFWRGQFAGFIVSGQFSYDKADIPPNGIIREEHLLALDVSFFDPHGTHLRTYNTGDATDDNETPVRRRRLC